MKNTKNERFGYIDICYAIGIILVVLGHSLANNWGDLTHNGHTLLRGWINSFHMPLFFFLSGFVSHIKHNSTIIEYVKKRMKRLLIPYYCINIIYVIPKIIFSEYAKNPIAVDRIFAFLLYPKASSVVVLWFLPVLFIINISLFCYFKKYGEKHLIIASIAIILLHFTSYFISRDLFGIHHVAYYYIFYWVGFLIFKYKALIIIKLKAYKICIPLLLVMHWYCWNFKADVDYSIQALLGAFFGIGLVLSIAVVFEQKLSGVTKYISQNSYQIYLLSPFGHAPMRILFLQIMNFDVNIVSLASFIGGLSIPLLLKQVITKKFPQLRIIIGMNQVLRKT